MNRPISSGGADPAGRGDALVGPEPASVALPMTVNGNNVGLNVTTNPNMAPPGWYMLFVTNAAGVPSVAKWVKLG